MEKPKESNEKLITAFEFDKIFEEGNDIASFIDLKKRENLVLKCLTLTSRLLLFTVY